MIPALKIGNLTAKIPIIQGGMGVGISLGGLAGAVAKEGAIGIISTAQIGFREKDFYENPLIANLRAMGEELKKARKIAPKGIIGFNIMVATNRYEEYVKTAVKAGADLIISGAGLPMDLPAFVGKCKTKLLPIVSSRRAANLILKRWDKKYNTTADAIVVEGPMAGGHLGFKAEELKDLENLGANYDREIQSIIEVASQYEKKYGREIPVIVAGGIRTKENMEHCFSLGAKGVQVATKFVTTKECDADIRYKNTYINCNKKQIKIVKSPVGMPARAIRNEFLDRVEKERLAPKHCYQCLAKCDRANIPYCITEALIHAAKGEIEDALLFCGADAYKETKIRTVKEVLGDFL